MIVRCARLCYINILSKVTVKDETSMEAKKNDFGTTKVAALILGLVQNMTLDWG